jgi:O-antigen ligase
MKPIRIGICALVAFGVLAHGAVEPWSEAVLETGASLLFLWWGVRFASGATPVIRWNWLLAPVAGLWVYGVLQYALRLTVAPFLTEIELLRFSALLILFFLALQSFETLEHWRGFVWFLLSLGFLVSVLGIVQYFTFNGKMYWFRELRYGGIPFGPFVNRNHFAGFVELVAPLGLSVLFLRAEHRDQIPLVAVLALPPIGALFLAASRGGIMSFLLEFGLVLVMVFLRHRGRNQLVAAIVVVLLMGGLVAWLGVGPALDRFSKYQKLEVTEGRRIEMSRDTWRIFLDHPIAGTGLGTLQDVFPQYESLYDGNMVLHSHNDYFEALAETGLIGGICGALFLVLLFRESWVRYLQAKHSGDLAYHIGAFAGCCGLLVHSLVDFNLHIPSNAFIFLLQAALATSLTPPSTPERAAAASRARYPESSIAIVRNSV